MSGVATPGTLKIVAASFNSNNNSVSEATEMGSSAQVVDSSLQTIVEPRRHLSDGTFPEEFRDFLKHPLLIHHMHITPATVPTIITLDLMALYLATATNLAAKISNLLYVETDIVVRAVVQGQPFAAGLINLVFTPRPQPDQMPDMIVAGTPSDFNIVTSFIVPHLSLDPSKNKTYEVTLPCPTMTGRYGLKSSLNNLGSYQVDILPVSPLFSGTAVSPTMDLCMYMHFNNPRFHGLTLLSNDFADEKRDGGTLSAIANTASAVAMAVAPVVPSLSPFLTLFSTVASGVGSVLKFFGFSKPQAVENSAVVLNRFGDNYSQYDGKSTSIVLAGSQTTSVGINPILGGGNMDDMSLSVICAKLGYLDRFNVTQARAFGFKVFSIAVRPDLVRDDLTRVCIPPIAGVSRMFRYWHGDIVFDIVVVASVYHRATLLLTWDPGQGWLDNPDMSRSIQTVKNATISVAGNTHVRFRIPWDQAVNYIPITRGLWTDWALNNANHNGFINLFVQNPVTANGSTDGIDVLVFVSSDNIKFYDPAVSQMPVNPVLLSVDFVDTVQSVDFGPKTDVTKSKFHSFGEDYCSVKQLTSKLTHKYKIPWPLLTVDPTVTVGLEFCFPNVPLVPTTSWSPPGAWTVWLTFDTWISQAYVGYRGGMRFSFHQYTSSGGEAEPHYWMRHNSVDRLAYDVHGTVPVHINNAPSLAVHASDTFALGLGNKLIAPMADGVFPSQIPWDFCPTQRNIIHYSDSACVIIPNTKLSQPEGATVWLELLTATSDDGQYVWFVGFPAVQSL